MFLGALVVILLLITLICVLMITEPDEVWQFMSKMGYDDEWFDDHLNDSKYRIIEVLLDYPETDKYEFTDSEDKIEKHLENAIYGRSVFEPVRVEEGGREIPNGLLEEIVDLDLFDEIVGFYYIGNILVDTNPEYNVY